MTLAGTIAEQQPAPEPLRLDFGCGKNKAPGYKGVDLIAFEGADYVFNAGRDPWPFEDGAVDGANASHFIEHLTKEGRYHFFNELYRVLKPGAQLSFAVPHFASCRAYGDPTHEWPPFTEFALVYLNREWRQNNAPHTDAENAPGRFSCDFDATYGYSMHQGLLTRNAEFQQFALTFYKEAAQDIVGTITRRA